MDLTGRLAVCHHCGQHMTGRSPEELRALPKIGRCYLCGRELPRTEPEMEYPVMRRFSTPEDRLRRHIAPVVTR